MSGSGFVLTQSCHCRICVQAASRKLDDDRAQLEEWGSRLAALTKEFDEAKQEVKSARTEIGDQRDTLASQAAALCAAQEQLEIQRQAILDARLDLDRYVAHTKFVQQGTLITLLPPHPLSWVPFRVAM
jgi:predicted  nucleic acid-binding Zn-ribbon protein